MFGELESYRQRPIPNLDTDRRNKIGYRTWPIDLDDSRAKEKCENVRNMGMLGLNHYHRRDNAPYYASIPGSIPELFLRTSIVEKLLRINKRLRANGLALFVHDAWRPAAIQSYFHDEWFPNYLRNQYPDWDDSRIMTEVEKYWARGARTHQAIDPLSPPPHATGAAIDLSLCTVRGDLLWMGTIFDDVTERAHPDFLEKTGGISLSDDEARKNRRLLYWLMQEEGFQVNPTEWWHFSWGDQMWAKLISAREGVNTPAWYSVIDPVGA